MSQINISDLTVLENASLGGGLRLVCFDIPKEAFLPPDNGANNSNPGPVFRPSKGHSDFEQLDLGQFGIAPYGVVFSTIMWKGKETDEIGGNGKLPDFEGSVTQEILEGTIWPNVKKYAFTRKGFNNGSNADLKLQFPPILSSLTTFADPELVAKGDFNGRFPTKEINSFVRPSVTGATTYAGGAKTFADSIGQVNHGSGAGNSYAAGFTTAMGFSQNPDKVVSVGDFIISNNAGTGIVEVLGAVTAVDANNITIGGGTNFSITHTQDVGVVPKEWYLQTDGARVTVIGRQG